MIRNRRMDPQVHTLAGAYALDAMDVDQRRMFEAHLEQCALCRAEVAQLQDTAALLGQAAEVVPPPGMRSRVLEQIGMIRQDNPVMPPDELRLRWTQRSSQSTHAGKTARRHPIFTVAAAVLVFAVLVLGTLYTQTTARLRHMEQQVAAMDVGNDLVAVLSAPDMRMSDVTVPTSGSARFVWSDQRNVGVLVGDHLPDPPVGYIYALWLISDGHAQYAGAFDPADDGGWVAQVAKGDVTKAEQLGVTAEPAGIPVRPTGAPVMSASLS